MSMMLPFSISFFRCVSRRTGSQIVTDPKEKQRQCVQHMAAYMTHVRWLVGNFSYFIALCVLRCPYMVMVCVMVTAASPKSANCYQIYFEFPFSAISVCTVSILLLLFVLFCFVSIGSSSGWPQNCSSKRNFLIFRPVSTCISRAKYKNRKPWLHQHQENQPLCNHRHVFMLRNGCTNDNRFGFVIATEPVWQMKSNITREATGWLTLFLAHLFH